ncbi:MAG: hypothetical protein HY840_05810 [Bacteroidetes bacterium]|nr:hypothetical protein [Bacteroidota bacterium]
MLKEIYNKHELPYDNLMNTFQIEPTINTKQDFLLEILRQLLRDGEIKNPLTKRKDKDGNTEEGVQLKDLHKYIITDKGIEKLKNKYWEWITNPENIWKIILAFGSIGTTIGLAIYNSTNKH